MRSLTMIVAGVLVSACSQYQSLPTPQKNISTLQCGEIGTVQYSSWTQGDAMKTSITIGSKTWNGTEEGGSMRFFTPDQPSENSPWMNFYQDKAWLYLNYKGDEGWRDLNGEQSSQYRSTHPELKTIECTPINRDDSIVGYWQSNDTSRPWISISYTGNNNNTFNIEACPNPQDAKGQASCLSQTGTWNNDTTFQYESSNSQEIVGRVNLIDDEITLLSDNQKVDTWVRKAQSMLCSFNGEALKQATIRDGTLIKIKWSDGPKMTYRPVAPTQNQIYQDTLGGRWKVMNRLQGIDGTLKLVNVGNKNTIACQPNPENNE